MSSSAPWQKIERIDVELTTAICLGFACAVLLPYYLRTRIFTIPEFLELRYTPAARLFFSVDFNGRARFTPNDFVNFVSNGFEACYEANVRYFEIHNEPNLPNEGMGWNWNSGADFGNWLQQVLNIVKPKFPDAKWGYPGLSPQPNVDAFLDGSAAAAAACDWIGVHCYWQQPEHQPPFPIDGGNSGYYWRAKFKPRFPNQMLLITEFSNNSAGVAPVDKGAQYADYIKLLRTELNIGAAFGFALNWPGQDNNKEGWEGSAIPGTFLARASSVGGTVRPSALAVLRLITSSNVVGCVTGKSAGLLPLRIRPA